MNPTWRRVPTVLWRRTSRSVVLLTPQTTQPLVLDGGATLVWDVLDEPACVAEAAALLAQACGIDEARVRHDVQQVLADLEAVGAVTTRESAS